MRVRNICVQNKVTKTITSTLCALFFASALAQAQATDLIEADPSTWTDNLTSEKVDLINDIMEIHRQRIKLFLSFTYGTSRGDYSHSRRRSITKTCF